MVMDLAHGFAAQARRRFLAWGKGEEQNVVLAASQSGGQGVQAQGVTEALEALGQGEPGGFQLDPHAAFLAEAREISGQTIGDIDGCGPALASQPATQLQLRPGPEVAPHRPAGDAGQALGA
jgi:hypothetical protein